MRGIIRGDGPLRIKVNRGAPVHHILKRRVALARLPHKGQIRSARRGVETMRRGWRIECIAMSYRGTGDRPTLAQHPSVGIGFDKQTRRSHVAPQIPLDRRGQTLDYQATVFHVADKECAQSYVLGLLSWFAGLAPHSPEAYQSMNGI